MTNPPPAFPPGPPGPPALRPPPPPAGAYPGPPPSWWHHGHTVAGRTLPRWAVALVAATGLLLGCGGLGLIAPRAERAATRPIEVRASTGSDVVSTAAPPSAAAAVDGATVVAAVRAAGVDVGEVREATGTCASYGCTRLTVTAILSVYEFADDAATDRVVNAGDGGSVAVRRGTTVVRLDPGGSTPPYDFGKVMGVLADLGFTPASPPPPAAPAATAAPRPTRPPTSPPPRTATSRVVPTVAPTTTTRAPTTTTAPPVRRGVTPGASCSPAGATGFTARGRRMRCTTRPDDPQLRWRAA